VNESAGGSPCLVPYNGIELSKVTGNAPNDIWAVGHGTALHFDGSTWKETLSDTERVITGTRWSRSVPTMCGSRGAEITVQWAGGTNDVWFVEHGTGLLHWNGTGFDATPLAGADTVLGVQGSMFVTGQAGMVRRR
jgi:hypothetical protein